MEKNHIVLFLVVFFAIFDLGSMVNAMGTKDGLEQWGYTEVRPGESMFWWYYKSPNSTRHWPLILWLQGGPGTSGVGMGNFLEIGPLDQHLNERESTWLDIADLLFVDCPIGTGYSYRNKSGEEVMGRSISDEETVSDLTQVLIQLYKSSSIEGLEERTLYIVGESYGGRYAAALALSLLHSIQFNATLGGVILGDAWISPVDYTNSWSPILKYASRLDEMGLAKCYKLAKLIEKQVEDDEDFENATASFLHLEQVIYDTTNGGDLYNLLLDGGNDPSTGDDAHFTNFMNNQVREKLQIIPNNVRWVKSSDLVFNLSAADFMRPRIEEVDSLLEEGINVTIYNGQWDVLCSPMGTEAWMEKLGWKWFPEFWSTKRTPIYYGEDNITTMGFQKSYRNLIYAVILGAGHHVPVDRPLVTRNLIRQVTNSPAA